MKEDGDKTLIFFIALIKKSEKMGDLIRGIRMELFWSK